MVFLYDSDCQVACRPYDSLLIARALPDGGTYWPWQLREEVSFVGGFLGSCTGVRQQGLTHYPSRVVSSVMP